MALMVVSVGFLCGCEEVEKDIGEALEGEYVSVSVYAYADVVGGQTVNPENVYVQFVLTKTGEDARTYDENIHLESGRSLCPYVGYNLYEDEYIYVSAEVRGIDNPVRKDVTLSFSNAKKDATDIGNDVWSYQWEPYFIFSI